MQCPHNNHILIIHAPRGTLTLMQGFKKKKKLQIIQNKCIRFCLKLDKMHHISEEDFKTINWLPVDQRVQQSLNVTVFKYVNKACPYYMKEVFEYASQGRISSRNNYAKLKVPFRKNTMGKKSLLYIGDSVWDKLSSSIKRNISLNEFKHDVKKHYLRELRILILLLSSSLLLLLLLLLLLSPSLLKLLSLLFLLL